MIEKAIEFIKKCNEKTAIIYDIDGDGISSAALIAKTINRIFYYMPYAFPMRYNFFSNNKIYNNVIKKKIKNIIILDIAVDEEPVYVLKIAKKAKVLVLDHHQVHKDLNKFNILHVNPYFWDKENSSKYCVSKLAFDICNKIVNIEDLAWLAGLGIINDYCGSYWKKFLNKVYEKYPILKQGKELYSFNSKLGLINHMITNSYHYAGINGVKISYEACLEANSPLDILDAKTAKAKALKYFYDKVQSEINEIVKNWKKYAEIHNGVIFLELKTKFALQSPISTIIGLKHKNRTVIVFRKIGKHYHVSIRREDGKVNCSELAKLATKNLKDASGGGHIPAAGCRILAKDLSKFKENVLEYLET
ncbi:MAG: DHH family phosphoesterase [Candidatus Aenigmatarchaeota archaeon]